MRSYASWLLLAVAGLGCQGAGKCTSSCDSPCNTPACPPPSKQCKELPPAASAPAVIAESAPCPAPQVEFRAPETIHVKAPAQKVIINTPAPAQEQAAAPQAVYAQAAPAPMMQTFAQAAPAPMVQAFAQPVAAQAMNVAGPITAQTVPTNRARLALGLDSIRIPLPILRFYAVPTTQEFTQTFVQPQAFAAPVQTAQFAVQSQAMPAQFVQAQAAPAQFAVQAQAAPAQLVPVQQAPQQVMVQAQAAPAQLVPVQAQAQPQIVSVQAQAAPAQMVPVQPQAQMVQMCPPCPVCPPCPTQGATQLKLEECTKEMEALKAMIKERYPAKPGQ